MTTQQPYASPEESASVIVADTRSPEEKLVDQMVADAGAFEQGAEYAPILYRVAVQLAAQRNHSQALAQAKITPARQARIDRVRHANELIKAISQHGRRFFWNEKAQRVARIELDERGKVWWVDDYRGARVCIEKVGGHEHRWQGFSHGGTLKQLVQAMREYIKTGERISARAIGQDCWGYSEEATVALRTEVQGMPIVQHWR